MRIGKLEPEKFIEAAKLIKNEDEKFCCFALTLVRAGKYEMEFFKRKYAIKSRMEYTTKDNEGGWFNHRKAGSDRQKSRHNALIRCARLAKEHNAKFKRKKSRAP